MRSWALQFKNRPRAIYVYTPVILLGSELQTKDQSERIGDTLQEQIAFLNQCAREAQPITFRTGLYSRLVDLTNTSREGDWEGLSGFEPRMTLNLIDAFGGLYLNFSEDWTWAEEIKLDTETYQVVLWAGASPTLGLDQTERRWGAFTYS